jgi:hypothetical protein
MLVPALRFLNSRLNQQPLVRTGTASTRQTAIQVDGARVYHRSYHSSKGNVATFSIDDPEP